MKSKNKFTDSQLARYARHIILPNVGGKGQRKLLESRVFVVGAGGLGSPLLMYLAAAGIGTIDVIDADRVDASNMQRQIVHRTNRIGVPKVHSAAETIAEINPDVRVHAHREWLTKENALELFATADVIVDGSDNFPTRYLVNDAAFMVRKPLVSGAMFRFEGQVSVFPNDGGADSPCYRCLFSEPPPAGLVPSCQEAGIFGAVPGVIGSIQATEVIKILLGIGESLAGRLLTYDAMTMKFRELKIKRDPDCALNGDKPSITRLEQYEQQVCEVPARPTPKESSN